MDFRAHRGNSSIYNIFNYIPILITIYKKYYKNKNSSSKRWNLKNPNWTLFSSIIEEDVKQLNPNNTDILSMVSLLTETIISAAKKVRVFLIIASHGGIKKLNI